VLATLPLCTGLVWSAWKHSNSMRCCDCFLPTGGTSSFSLSATFCPPIISDVSCRNAVSVWRVSFSSRLRRCHWFNKC
jgi:hypothetical protein